MVLPLPTKLQVYPTTIEAKKEVVTIDEGTVLIIEKVP
jgi:hypothetical protein